MSLRGSCLCGGVRYEIEGDLERASRCFCSLCRKQTGSAFGTYGFVPADRFRLLTGTDLIRSFHATRDVTRTFCGRCGSTLQWKRAGRDGFSVALGTLDDNPDTLLAHDLHVDEVPPWHGC